MQTNDLTSLDFNDLEPIELPVTIKGKQYVLREATEDVACKYRNSLLKSTKLGPEGKPSSIEGMADAEPLLVSLCLYELYDDPKTHTLAQRVVLLSFVRSLPSRVVKPLFERAKAISGLDEKDDEEALTKRIGEDTKALAKLRKEGSFSKNLPEPTEDSLPSPMS